MVGIKEVAERAGVSQSTVSRCLNGRPGVSEESRHAVETALRQLGVRRAGHLLAAATPLVALVMPTVLDPFFSTFAHEATDELARSGIEVVLAETPRRRARSEAQLVERMVDRGVEGLVFLGGAHNESAAGHEHLEALARRGTAIVLVNAGVPGLAADHVVCDDRSQVERAWTHLRALGHSHVGLVLGPPDHVPSLLKARAAAELSRTARPGRDAYLRVRWTDYSVESAQAETTALLAAGATAIVAASTDLTLGALLAIRRTGAVVPDDVSVVGFSESPVLALTDPPLTQVQQPVAAMARAAARCVRDGLERPHAVRHLVHEPELVLRHSTGGPRK